MRDAYPTLRGEGALGCSLPSWTGRRDVGLYRELTEPYPYTREGRVVVCVAWTRRLSNRIATAHSYICDVLGWRTNAVALGFQGRRVCATR